MTEEAVVAPQLRVALTDGIHTVLALWIRRGRDGAFAGLPISDLHRSYHDDGRIHTKEKKRYSEVVKHDPIAALRLPHFILAGFYDDSVIRRLDRQRSKRTPVDPDLLIDVRQVPARMTVGVHVGLVPPDAVRYLQNDFGMLALETTSSPFLFAAVNYFGPSECVEHL